VFSSYLNNSCNYAESYAASKKGKKFSRVPEPCPMLLLCYTCLGNYCPTTTVTTAELIRYNILHYSVNYLTINLADAKQTISARDASRSCAATRRQSTRPLKLKVKACECRRLQSIFNVYKSPPPKASPPIHFKRLTLRSKYFNPQQELVKPNHNVPSLSPLFPSLCSSRLV
jgi:hypothetical protein